MITFLDERDVEHGALATIKVTNAVNGERSLTGEIESGDYVLTNIERGWRLRFDDEFYVVTYAKPIDDGKGTHVTFDAVHQFFWDFDKSSVHEQLNDGSHTFLTYLDFIFTGSDYTYTIDPLLKVYAFEKQSFGYKSRLKLFNDIITSSGVEFQVNGKVVRILEKTGTDLSTVVRKNFNMNELGIEKHIGDFVTYQKGFGAWIDENDHSKGRLVTEYTSPLASVYGKLEAEPLVDERYTQADNMIAALKANVDNSYSISITLDMEDLTRAGYDYTQPRAGDYIMAINETLDFQEKIRIVSFTSEYDVSGQLVKHEVTCNDIGVVKKLSASYNLTKEQAQNASDSVGKAVEMANKALVSADGKSTVYFGNEFPKNEPKGTLHKGDSLYLTVGDTTKMYYWTGADWEELPIVNDVEAFKEQIADELKDVPNREEFEATITEKLATSKAEIKTQIDTAKTQAESNAKAYADEINQATAGVAEQANTAANSLKSDLAKVKTDLTTTTSTANAAKTSASEAKQQLTTVANDLSKAKTDLQNAVSAVDTKATNLQSDLTTAKQDLQAQASQLTAQANAQSELTNRVSSVEETANGTKTTVSELSKTVAQNGKDITSVTNRTKTVEDDLANTKTTLTQVQTTANSASQKTATLETGLNGLTAKFENLSVGTTNHFLDSAFETTIQKNGITQNGDVYTPSIDTTEKYYGYNTLKIVCEDSTGVDNPKITYPALAKLKTVQQGKLPDVVTISFWGKTDTEGMGLYTRLGFTSYEDSQNVTLTTDWKRYIVHVKTSSAATNEWLFKLSKAGTVWIAKPQFEFSAIASDYHSAEEDTSSKVAEYKQTADQNYARLQSNLQTLDGTVKQNKSEFDQTASQLKTSISTVEGKIPTNVSTRNLILKSNDFANPHKQTGANTTVTSTDDYFVIKSTGYTANAWGGMSWNMSISEVKAGEQFSILMPVYIDSSIELDNGFSFNIKNHTLNLYAYDYSIPTDKKKQWFNVAITFKTYRDIVFDSYPFYVYLVKNGLVRIKPPILVRGNLIPSDYQPAFEDTKSDVTKLNTTLTQTANGLQQLSTQVTSQGSTIISHTNSINSLATGLSAKVSQTDFNTLSGRVTTAENNITAKANELSSKITKVEGKIPTSSGGRNLAQGTSKDWSKPFTGFSGIKNTCPNLYKVITDGLVVGDTFKTRIVLKYTDIKPASGKTAEIWIQGAGNVTAWNSGAYPSGGGGRRSLSGSGETVFELTDKINADHLKNDYWSWAFRTDWIASGSLQWKLAKVERGMFFTDWSSAPEDYDSKLASAQSEIKQTTDSIKASVSSLDKSTVKSASLTINTDGIVMKAGKSTTDVANAIGSYFAVNQNAINLFSDKINVKGSMIVDGAITSNKIASKSINTAHLNGKIITADVIATNAVTANAIKAGAVTTNKMIANSINGDRITAGTLDAAKIKAGSITASQIASGTITSAQIKTGTISAANIAAGAITTDKIAANSINSSKIVSSGITANVIKGGVLQSLNGSTNFELDTGKLFYNNNNTGVFRVQDGASTMGLKFSNTSISVAGTSRILSRAILGGDRRESTLDDGKWDKGGFSGLVIETIKGVEPATNEHADAMRVISDNIYFTHTYSADSPTGISAHGWKMETYSPDSSYSGNIVLKPYGINYRQSDIVVGDIRLDNGDGSGYWMRATINVLKACFGHILNGGLSSEALNAIRSELNKISGT